MLKYTHIDLSLTLVLYFISVMLMFYQHHRRRRHNEIKVIAVIYRTTQFELHRV